MEHTGKRKAMVVVHNPVRVFLTTIILVPSLLQAQVNHKKSFSTVLRNRQVGKLYRFDKSAKGHYDNLELVYLGSIKTNTGRTLKIVTSRWYWGLGPRATSRIVVFDDHNRYLGDYNVNMTYNVPKKIEGRSLVFISDGTHPNCDPGTHSQVDFSKDIPKHFGVTCTGEEVFFNRNLDGVL